MGLGLFGFGQLIYICKKEPKKAQFFVSIFLCQGAWLGLGFGVVAWLALRFSVGTLAWP